MTIRRALALLTTAGALLGAPAAAPAQAPGTTYSGGSVGTLPDGERDLGDSDVGIRVLPNGLVAVRAVHYVACARNQKAEIAKRGTGTLNGDGTFSAVLRHSTQLETRGYRSRSVVTGRIEGGQATGELAGTASGGSLRLRDCQGSTSFVARTATALGDRAAPAPAEGAFLGSTSATARGPFGAHVRVSGGRIVRVLVSFRRGCRTLGAFEETNFSPATAIGPDGRFEKNERFKIPLIDAVETVRVRMNGRFVEGGVQGTFRWSSVVRSRRTGRVTDRCDTGAIRWSATPA